MARRTVVGMWLVGLMMALVACGGGGAGSEGERPGRGGEEPAQTQAVFAISATPRLVSPPADDAAYQARIDEAEALASQVGSRGLVIAHTWRDLEPAAGGIDGAALAAVQASIERARAGGKVVHLALQVINTIHRELPAGFDALPFDHPTVIARLRVLLERIVAPNVGRIRYLAIGNEVDAYLKVHPSEWSSYRALLTAAFTLVRSLDPSIRLGVVTTFEGATAQSRAEVTALNQGSDVVMLTYYPVRFADGGHMQVRSPDEVSLDFAAMAAVAGSRPVVLQEVGFPAATESGSTETLQARFVERLFEAWQSRASQFEFMNYFLLHDFTPDICASLASYYGDGGNGDMHELLCSLGLRRADGTPRIAWSTLLAEAEKRRAKP